ncbi:protein FAR-RED IMPAIRED RESPONSE 1-like [Tripterygium wilfordii]|uniref:protein FAR-RED IMPAIRED RESPONSE 1-like n=1 Tax=Tripterygium wilfordii TaxID=458696 RepID=UPI0018F83C98|nr:protein FAR-RED IMPAIRED RESPONSE 1-like [Tripterygium wilfordii]
MSSSQRAESCHAFFKSYVSKKNTLMDFVVRFTRALKHQRHQELMLDHKDINEQPITKTMWPMEKFMAEVYTQTIFYKVQEELYQGMAYMATIDYEEEHMSCYNVVRVDGSPHKVHATLPDIYVLRRWTKAAKSSTSIGDVRDTFDRAIVLRQNTLRKLTSNIIYDSVINEDTYKFAVESLESLQCNLNALTLKDGGQSSAPSIALSQPVYNEPNQVRAKGCGKRLKRGKEKAIRKDRRCNGCGLYGQKHDIRNCPLLNNKRKTCTVFLCFFFKN